MPDPSMRSGDLRHRITIESRTTSQDAYKDTVESWSTVGTYWACIRPASGREQVVAEQLQAQVTHSIVMRHQGATSITPKMRVTFGSRTFHIQSVTNVDERNYMLQLYAVEVV